MAARADRVETVCLATSGGVVALLFTDLVRSTELLTSLGDDAADELRRRHFAGLRQAVAATNGEEIKSLGDGLMVSFTSPVAALSCAVAMQGSAVVVAKRLCDAAQGGQILTSQLGTSDPAAAREAFDEAVAVFDACGAVWRRDRAAEARP